MQEQITAALKKLGHPVAPGALAKALGVEGHTLGYHMKIMLEAGTLKAIGNRRSRRVGLPDHEFAGGETPTPPHQRRKSHKKAKHAKKARSPKTAPRAARAAAPTKTTERFIPAVDAASRLIIVNGAEPYIFSEAQTEAIAALLFQHYDKG